MVFTKFMLAGIRFCTKNFFLQDTATVATHKRRQFLRDISTRQKICYTSSNKTFIKISLPLGSTFRKK